MGMMWTRGPSFTTMRCGNWPGVRAACARPAGRGRSPPRTILPRDALRKLARGPRGLRQTGGKPAFPQARLGPAERRLEALRAERLEQVVDGVSVKGPHGVLVPGGHKNDGRTALD